MRSGQNNDDVVSKLHFPLCFRYYWLFLHVFSSPRPKNSSKPHTKQHLTSIIAGLYWKITQSGRPPSKSPNWR
jgi:hypothetical protein